MEAVPRMPMLSFELKQSPEYVEFASVLKPYIRENYGEDPAQYNKACNDLEQLRQTAVHVSHDFMGCSTLKKYYAQLQLLQGRFPMGEGAEASIAFTWEDVHLGREVTISDIKFEQACILYNIGALHSILGTMETRQSADGMKVACTHFQCAAWAFEYLRDHFGSALMSVDMSHDLLTFQVNLMLAQAQECILEKSMIDSRKSSITAKVAAQIVEFYRVALRNLETVNSEGLISSRKNKDWKKRMDVKVLFYTCITNYYMGRQSEEQQKSGECLAWYTIANNKLGECTKVAKGEVQDVQESLRFANDVVGGKFQSAKKDNEFVYHEKVPAADSLPEVKGASLVKGIPFNPNDPEVSGVDIFQKLVPMQAHETSSLYSEEKARLIRQVVGEIEEKNDELVQFMSSLQLDQARLNNEPERLPQQLLEKCAAISVRPNAIKDLVDSMGAVSNVATEVELAIREIRQLLEQEATAEEEFQKQFGKRSPNTMLGSIAKDCDHYEEGHKTGSKSNSNLHNAMNAHIANLKMISGPLEELQRALPSLTTEKQPEDDTVMKDMQRILGKVEEMKTQRASLEKEFRDQVHNDDITNVIVTQEGKSNESLFQEQLKKHDKLVSLIRQNVAAQENILRALTDTNAQYAGLRRTTADVSARRETSIRELINSYDVYEELLAKSHKGLDFYKKLEANVTRLLDRCRGLCKIQHEEREQIINRYKPKAPPPTRPMAPKPGAADVKPSQHTPVITPEQMADYLPSTPTMLPGQPGLLPGQQGGTAPVSTIPSSVLPGFEGPKLKDYLPFMKPKTFGKDSPASKRLAAGGDSGPSSLPGSLPDSPIHIPSGTGSLPGSPLHSLQGHMTPHDMGFPHGKQGMTDLSGDRSGDPGRGHHFPPRGVPGDVVDYPSPAQSPHMQHTPGGPNYPSPSQSPHPSDPRQMIYSANPPSSQGPPQLPPSTGHQFNSGSGQQTSVGPVIGHQIGSVSGQQLRMVSGQQIVPSSGQQLGQFSGQQVSAGQVSAQQSSLGHISGQQVSAGQVSSYQMSMGYSVPSIQAASQSYNSQLPDHSFHSNVRPPGPQQFIGSVAGPQQGMNTSVSSHSPMPSLHPSSSQPGVHPKYDSTNTVSTIHTPVIHPANAAPPFHQHYIPTSQQPGMPSQPLPQQQPRQPLATSQPQSGQQVPGQQLPQQLGQQLPGQFTQQAQHLPGQHVQQLSGQPLPGQPVQQWLPGQQVQQSLPGQQIQSRLPGQQVQQQLPGQQVQQQLPGQQFQLPMAGQPQAPQQQFQGHMPQPQQVTQGHMSGQQPPPPGQQPQQQIPKQHVQQYLPGQQANIQSQGQQIQQHLPGQQIQQHLIGQQTQQQLQGQQIHQQTQQQLPGQQIHQQTQQQLPGQHIHQQSQQQLPGQQINQQLPSQQTQHQLPRQQIQQQLPGQQTQQQLPGQQIQQQLPGQQTQQQLPGQQIQQQLPSQQIQQQLPSQYQHQMPGHQQLPGQRFPSMQGQHLPQQQLTRQQNDGQQPQTTGQQMLPQSQGQMGQHTGQQSFPQYPQSGQFTGQLQTSNQQQPGQQGGPNQQNQQQIVIRQQIATSQPQVPQQLMPQQPSPRQQQPSPRQPVPQTMQQQSFGQPRFSAPSTYPGYQGQPQQNQGQARFPSQPIPQSQGQGQPQQVMGSSQSVYGQSGQPAQKSRINPLSPDVVQTTQLPSPLQPCPVQSSVEEHQPEGVTQLAKDLQSVSSTEAQKVVPPDNVATVTGPPAHKGHQRNLSVSSNSSSLDDILSSSPTAPSNIMLTPKVLTAQEIQQQKEEALMKNSSFTRQASKDPYGDSNVRNKFVAEVEKLAKFVESLDKTTCSGPTHLDLAWKELIEEQEREGRKLSMAIARCYTAKNRELDVMPYDETRVVLTSHKDDYINASWINELSPSCPKFIATQAPLSSTIVDFWMMVYEQGVEVIAMLTSSTETGKKFPEYWPLQKDRVVHQGPLTLTLRSLKDKQLWTERIIYLYNAEAKQGRTVVQLEFKNWPVSGFPEKVSYVLQFITEVHSFYRQQRSLLKPVLVHCSNGIGRTGTFMLIYTSMQEIDFGNGIVNVQDIAKKMLRRRRNAIREKSQLKYCYEAILYYAQDILAKQGILVHKASFGDKLPQPGEKTNQWTPTDDVVFGSMSLKTLQSNMSKLGMNMGDIPTSPQEETQPESSKSQCSLPDVVQQPQTQLISDIDTNQNTQEQSLPSQKTSRSGSNASILSSDPGVSVSQQGSVQGSHEGSPLHVPHSGPTSLEDLQDPKTFTLGPGSKQKKITKASFTQKQAGLDDSTNDPEDPLSSLDPLWSIHKK